MMMVHVISGEIINMSNFDTARKFNASASYPKEGWPCRIAFFKGAEEAEYVSFDSELERDDAWTTLIFEINSQYK